MARPGYVDCIRCGEEIPEAGRLCPHCSFDKRRLVEEKQKAHATGGAAGILVGLPAIAIAWASTSSAIIGSCTGIMAGVLVSAIVFGIVFQQSRQKLIGEDNRMEDWRSRDDEEERGHRRDRRQDYYDNDDDPPARKSGPPRLPKREPPEEPPELPPPLPQRKPW